MRKFHTFRPVRTLGAIALTAALGLTAAGCGGGSDSSSTTSTSVSSAQSSSTDHNDADVAFATDMLPHHSQAVAMVELTAGRPLGPEVQQLADEIRAAQTPEIETMTGWLTDWDEKVPDTGGAMDDMGSMEGADSSMPGMMSADDMSSLEAASDADFQTMWLEMMVKHHEGAVEMAKTEIADGQYQPALDLANSIVTSQSKEIATMRRILG